MVVNYNHIVTALDYLKTDPHMNLDIELRLCCE